MATGFERTASAFRRRTLRLLAGPEGLVFVPALTLAAFHVGGTALLSAVALALPLALAGLRSAAPRGDSTDLNGNPESGVAPRQRAVDALEAGFAAGPERVRRTSALAVGIDEMAELEARLGRIGVERVVTEMAARLKWSVRATDMVAGLGDGAFGIALFTRETADIDMLLSLCARLQAAASRPIMLDGSAVYASVSVGFCPAGRAPAATGEALLGAAEQALAKARSKGAGTIRAFSPELGTQAANAAALTSRVRDAIASGEIGPWFQPQVSVGTGEVTGVEALARWSHSDLGLLPPAEFLPVVECAGLGERLTAHMLAQSLAALAAWDREGLNVPSVSINFTADDLRNPHLAEHLKWELDRAGLTPDRLTVEVLETVIATTRNDTIIRNLWAVAELGCGIDLDDFGTGHASIGNIRRFSVQRVKIDRSFVSRLDSDPDQRNVVAAIILMAERLNLDTLAEGVETAAEQAALARLGCGHAQGYGIARPMSPEATGEWLRARAARPGAAAEPAPLLPDATTPREPSAMGKTA